MTAFSQEAAVLGQQIWRLLSVIDRRDVFAGAGAELDEFWGTHGAPETGPRAYPVEADERV